MWSNIKKSSGTVQTEEASGLLIVFEAFTGALLLYVAAGVSATVTQLNPSQHWPGLDLHMLRVSRGKGADSSLKLTFWTIHFYCIISEEIRYLSKISHKNASNDIQQNVPQPQMILCIICQIWKGADNSEKLNAPPSWTFWPTGPPRNRAKKHSILHTKPS